MDDAGLFGAELDLAALGRLHRLGDVLRHRAEPRVRHQPARPEDLAEPADQRHHVGGGDRPVEIDLPGLDLLGEILGADDIGAGGLGLLGLVAAREDARPARVLPVPCGSITVPRKFWSCLRGSMLRFIAISTVSSNFAEARYLISLTAVVDLERRRVGSMPS